VWNIEKLCKNGKWRMPNKLGGHIKKFHLLTRRAKAISHGQIWLSVALEIAKIRLPRKLTIRKITKHKSQNNKRVNRMAEVQKLRRKTKINK